MKINSKIELNLDEYYIHITENIHVVDLYSELKEAWTSPPLIKYPFPVRMVFDTIICDNESDHHTQIIRLKVDSEWKIIQTDGVLIESTLVHTMYILGDPTWSINQNFGIEPAG